MRNERESHGLIGRGRELAAISELCQKSRLVTIWGAGGVGKTKLALGLARQTHEATWFCDLSDAGDATGLCAAVAYRLGIALEAEPVPAIGRWLARHGRSLLVLDNFEQLAHLAGTTIRPWLDAAPELSIVVTSRERLRIADEVCYELGPLGLPSSASELADSESFQLLRARLRSIDPSFPLAEAEPPALVALLVALEGMPLSIELAAPRVALLGVAGLLERLDRRLDALDCGARDLPRRQSSLRESMRWSWDLLAPAARRALSWFSVFRGGFAVEAAESLFGAAGVELLRELRDASLLRTLRPGRFTLYEIVREFAGEELDRSGERVAAAQRHAAFVVQRCAQLACGVEERGEPLDRLQEERWNLEQALRFAIAAGEREHAVQAALALGPLLSSQGPLVHLVDALGAVLAVAPGEPRILHARGRTLARIGRLTEAERDLGAACEAMPEPGLRAHIAKDLGVLYHQRRDIEQAGRQYAEALELAIVEDDRRLRGICVGNQGALHHDTGAYGEAAALYEEGLAIVRGVGDLRTEGVLLTNLAVLHQELERFDRSRREYKRAMAILHGLGDLRGEGLAIENLAVLEHLDGNLEDSRELHERARALLETAGDERSQALCRARLGAVLAQLGERELAHAQLDRAAALLALREDPIARRVLDLLWAFVELAEGDRSAARARLRAARARSGGAPLVAVSDDARTAAAVLEAWLAKSSRLRLTIGPAAQWFQSGDQAQQSLRARPTHARLLAHLAELHEQGHERRAGVAELFNAGWSGEVASVESANNRVHVALTQLRKLGLGQVIERADDGYRLAPEWLIVRKRGPG